MGRIEDSEAQLLSPKRRARRALKAGRVAGELDAANEAVVRRFWHELDWCELVTWLALPAVADSEGRPVGEVVERIATLAAPDIELLVSGPKRIETIQDGSVRNEVLRALRPTLASEQRWRFDPLGSGGALFGTIRDFEKDAAPPWEVLVPGPKPSLTSELFDTLTNDLACRQQLQRCLGEGRLRLYTFWVLERVGLLSKFGSLRDLMPGVVTPVENILEGERTRFLLGVAARWERARERDDWFSEWALEARSRGVRWEELWLHIPEESRGAVAIASLRTEVPAPWAPWSLLKKGASSDHWQLFFELLPRMIPHQGLPLSPAVGLVLGRVLDPSERALWRDVTCESGWMEQMFRAPMPSDAGPEFDKQFVLAAHQLGVPPRHALQHLVKQAGLSTDRAIALILEAESRGILWNWEPVQRLVGRDDVRGHIAVEPPRDLSESAVNAFLRLRGDHGVRELRAYAQTLVGRGAVPEALTLAGLAPEVLDDELREAGATWARSRTLSEAVALRERHPWLLTDAELVDKAEARGDWEGLGHIPSCLVPVVSSRVPEIPDAREAARLLGLLERAGLTRHQVMGLAVRRLETLGVKALTAQWLGKNLDNNTLWKKYGADVVTRLLEAGPDGARLTFEVCCYAPRTESMAQTLHTVLAACLIRLAEVASAGGDGDLAARSLRALYCLSPSSRVWGALHGLRKLDTSSEVSRLIELNENELRHAKKQAKCELGDIGDALSELLGEQEDDR